MSFVSISEFSIYVRQQYQHFQNDSATFSDNIAIFEDDNVTFEDDH
jgi:hypothetical protein